MPRVRKRSNSTDLQVRSLQQTCTINTFHKETELPHKKVKTKHEENEDKEVQHKTVESVVDKDAGTSAKTSLYKPPTFEELQNLKEAEMLFQSNLLKLQVHMQYDVLRDSLQLHCPQITELLAEVMPKKKPSLDNFLKTMRSTLLSIKSTEPMNVRVYVSRMVTVTLFLQLTDALACLPRHVKYPLQLDYSSGVKGNFHLTPPQVVKIIGSYLLQSLTKPELNVDVAVEIPQVSGWH